MSRRVAILVPGSPTPAFYAQVAALRLAVSRLAWSTWQPSIHLFLGGEVDPACHSAWRPFLRDVEITLVSKERFERGGWWEQSDDVFRRAPAAPDVLLTLDADVLPFAPFEDLLDRVADEGLVAGVMAHYPFPGAGDDPQGAWRCVAEGLIDKPVAFEFHFSLDASRHWGATPFYVNMGVVFFARKSFDTIAELYLSLRPRVAQRLTDPDYSAQVALTLALHAQDVPLCELPMRYNFPNDPLAMRLYPHELTHVVFMHYLRTHSYDRHRILTEDEEYRRFVALELEGVDKAFQQLVIGTFGMSYPFPH